jgi:DHA1 family multidrug resistance protein-like MFS transporter
VRNFEVSYIALKVEELTTSDTAAFWTGITSAAVCGAAILSGVVSGYLVDRLPAGKILIPVMILSAAALVLQGAAQSLCFFAVGRVLLYTAAGGLQPVLQKVLSSVTPQRKRGGVFGFASSSQSLGGMAAAVVSGFAMTYCGISGVFYIAAVFFAVSLPLMLQGIFRATRPFVFHRLRRHASH